MKPVFRMAVVLILSAVAMAFPALDAGAADGNAPPPREHRLDFRMGLYSPEATDVENLDPGFHVEAAYGRYFLPYLGIEAGLGYFQAERSSLGLDQKVSATSLSLGVVARLPVKDVEFSASAGVNGSLTKIRETFSGSTAEDRDLNLGYQVGAGIDWYFTPEYFIGLNGRYLWLEADDTDVDLDGILVDVGVGFRF